MVAPLALLSLLAVGPVGPVSAAQLPAPAPGRELAVGDPGSVLGMFRLNDLLHPFELTLGEHDRFGSAIASLGDLDGNGNLEYAIGAPGDNIGRGAVWILSIRADRSVPLTLKYGPTEKLPFTLDPGDGFGAAITAIGDVNGDGVDDIAVGAPGDDDGTTPPFSNSGAVWVLFLGLDGNIHGHLKFSRTSGGFPGLIQPGDSFGSALAPIGDLDGNGVPDLLVGAPGDNDGGNNRGALWVLFFATDDTVLGAQRISQTQGGFGGTLTNGDAFGASLARMGDMDGDGKPEVAVGASAVLNGEVWMLSLAPDGTAGRTVLTQSFSSTGAHSLLNLGDLDHDGVSDLAVGTLVNLPAGPDSVHILRLNADGSVKATTVLPEPTLPTVGLVRGDFGAALTSPGDTDGDGNLDLAVGVPAWSGRLNEMGGFLLYNLSSAGLAVGNPVLVEPRTSRMAVAPNFLTGSSPRYGDALAPLGDVDGDGFPEVAIGSPGDDDGAVDAGAVWIHFLSPTDALRVAKLSAYTTNLPLASSGAFGASLAQVGDLDGNGVVDLAVGAPTVFSGPGTMRILFLTPSGGLLSQRLITPVEAGFTGFVAGFGSRLDTVGDVNLDGRVELIAQTAAKKRLLFLRSDGSVESSVELTFFSAPGFPILDYGKAASGRRYLLTRGGGSLLTRYELDGFGGTIPAGSASQGALPTDLAVLGDIDGDGLGDIAIVQDGLVRLQLLNADLSRKSSTTFQGGQAPHAITALGDLTGDGVVDLGGATRFGEDTSVFLAQLGGVGTLDFEHRDTSDQLLNENGRALPPELSGYTFTLTSLGANLGPAAFDSTLVGPNAGGLDADLLVDSGKVLILQESLHGQQTRPGIFDQPNDDVDGGTLVFAPRRPIRALALKVIDIDPGAGQGATVELFDEAGRVRIYDLPPGFTEDRTVQGGSGWRRLDLTTLAPQAGFAASATAAQSNGFDEKKVVRIEVTLGSSGAIDDLVYDPFP
jgi:FG-GAP repeat protein